MNTFSGFFNFWAPPPEAKRLCLFWLAFLLQAALPFAVSRLLWLRAGSLLRGLCPKDQSLRPKPALSQVCTGMSLRSVARYSAFNYENE